MEFYMIMGRTTSRKLFLYFVLFVFFMIFFYSWNSPCMIETESRMVPQESVRNVYDSGNRAYPYHRKMPLIFIGGVPRSGTTLMRAMLDAHPEVRCGEETRVIPRILGMHSQWSRAPKEHKRLEEAGLTASVLDDAISAFILEVIAKHGEPAARLCNKDPFTLKSTIYLSSLFPNSKFLFMIRDGRATVHSIMSRKITITGFDINNFKVCLQKWNVAIESMYYQCMRVGSSRCLPVYYEQLVLHPKEWMVKILNFLNVSWDDAVLHHNELINKPGGVSLSKVERSTDQVIKPVNLEALNKWVGAVPEDVKLNIRSIAPMLERLGYDPDSYPANYGQADRFVIQNTNDIKANEDFWRKRGQEVFEEEGPPKDHKYINKFKDFDHDVKKDPSFLNSSNLLNKIL